MQSREMSQRGFSLLELMVAVAIVAILSAVAIPLYSGYVQTSREGVLVYNISSMELFQEDFRLRTGNYLTNAANLAAIEAAINWTPQKNDGSIYSIAPGPGISYQVTATSPEGTTVCLQLPDNIRC